uniref:Uncharacterized protein n=1 Tax=Plectus sambesii TaxID=2011161 RepID=A0A914VEX2_9BILA
MSGYYPLPIPSRPWTRAQTQLRQQQYDMAVSLSRPYAHYQQQYHQVAMTSYSMATSKEAQLASFVPQIAGQSEMDGCVQVGAG